MKIFIIDDDELSLFLAQQMIALAGPEGNVHLFQSASKALHVIAEGRDEEIPDVILLDLNMPLMNGRDFLDALSKLEKGLEEKCRIYILSASPDQLENKIVALNPMVHDFFLKPITSENVAKVLLQGDFYKCEPL